MAVIKGVLGRKIGMTQVFKEGVTVPVTVISAGPCLVLEIKKKDIHGYNALKIGYEELKKNSKKYTKPLLGLYKKNNTKALKYMQEIRIDEKSSLDKYKVGQEIKVNIFKVGDFVDVTSFSKGKGFQGGVKRWGWRIGPKSHGSMSQRAIGSIGASSFPSRVLKGLHMPGHMGNDKVTVQNLEIVDINAENNVILIKGSVPGARKALMLIKSARKKESLLEIPEEKEEKDIKNNAAIEDAAGEEESTEKESIEEGNKDEEKQS